MKNSLIKQSRRATDGGGGVPAWILTWGRGRRRARPAAGCGPCWGWSGPDTAAACVRCTTRCLRPPAESPACLETARSQTSSPPGDKKKKETTHGRCHSVVTLCFTSLIVTAERPPHLLGYPPQLVVTVASVWVQVHPERSSENEDFLVKTKGKQRQSESSSILRFFSAFKHWGWNIVIFQTENSA